MIGNITQPNSESELSNPNIYIMDIRSYVWVNSFEITSNKTDNSQNPQPDNNELKSELVRMKIIIASVGGIVGVAIIIVCGFLIYKWNKKRNEQPTLIIPSATAVRYIHDE